MLSWRDRQERIEARGVEYRAGAMTEAQFSAYLFSMHLRGEDISHKLREYAPPVPPQTFEERRFEVSHQWMEDYRNGRRS